MRIVFFVLIISLISCNGEEAKPETVLLPSPQETADMNKAWIAEEHEIIQQFVERRKWNMTKTGSGLRYLIYKEGKGEKAEPGKRAMINYSITLLDGTEVFSTEKSGPRPFLIERDNVEYGLHEGIIYMRVGDKAKMILPSYLAHGLIGDRDKIPPQASLIFDVSLLGLSN